MPAAAAGAVAPHLQQKGPLYIEKKVKKKKKKTLKQVITLIITTIIML